MENKLKFIVVGLVVILAISLFVAFQNYSAKEMLQREKDKLSEENALLNSKINKLEGVLRDSEGKIKALNTELDKISQEKKEIENKYELAKKSRDELAEKLKTQQASESKIAKDKADLELQVERLRSELNAVRVIKDQLQREKSGLESDLDILRRNREDLGREAGYGQQKEELGAAVSVRKIETPIVSVASVELPPIVVRPKAEPEPRVMEYPKAAESLRVAPAPVAPRPLETAPAVTRRVATTAKETPVKKTPQIEAVAVREGKILAVIRENNFVVIDVGEETGVKAGDAFGVYRKGKKIATIETIRTAKNVAACDIKEETKSILVGDTVK